MFRDLRERFGVTAEDYVTSICTEPAREIEVSKKSQAQTAKRMLFSTHDSEFLLQTLSRDEVERVCLDLLMLVFFLPRTRNHSVNLTRSPSNVFD